MEDEGDGEEGAKYHGNFEVPIIGFQKRVFIESERDVDVFVGGGSGGGGGGGGGRG